MPRLRPASVCGAPGKPSPIQTPCRRRSFLGERERAESTTARREAPVRLHGEEGLALGHARDPRRHRHRRRAGADPRHRRRVPARRRRLRGHAPLRRPAVRPRGPPDAPGPARPPTCGCRSTSRPCAPTVETLVERNEARTAALRVLVTRGGRRLGHRRGAEADCPRRWRSPASSTRRRACSTRSSRCPTPANMLARRLAAGAGRRRRAARDPARPRPRGADDVVRVARWTARRSSRRRSSDHILDSITRRQLLGVVAGAREQVITRDELRARARGVPGLDDARGPCRCARSTAPSCPPRRARSPQAAARASARTSRRSSASPPDP